jgi:secretion/DNA translocation related TadE-like protein
MTPLTGGWESGWETGPWHGYGPRSRGRRRSQERGAGTVLALGVALVVILGAALLLLLARSAVAASRAAAAADLAALAAADAARGITPGDPCTVARDVALKNHAAVLGCSQAPDASVQVRTELNAGPLLGVARGLARAGPPPDPDAVPPPG